MPVGGACAMSAAEEEAVLELGLQPGWKRLSNSTEGEHCKFGRVSAEGAHAMEPEPHPDWERLRSSSEEGFCEFGRMLTPVQVGALQAFQRGRALQVCESLPDPRRIHQTLK